MSNSDDDAAVLQSPVLPPYPEPAAASHNLAQLIRDHLRIEDEHPVNHTHRRTTSSSYHGPDSEPSRVQSPISNGNANMLSVTNLAKYGKTNDRLSNLRSASPSSMNGDLNMQEISGHSGDSSSTANSLQTQPSKVVVPYTYERQISRYRFASSPSESVTNDRLKGYDGADETVLSSRPSLAPSPASSLDGHSPIRRAKRRASQFSLRSLSKSFSKRSHLGFRKWANSVYRESSRRFSVARQKMKEHAETERRDFSAWKAQRRKSKASEAKKQKKNGTFHQKNPDWWKDGLAKYQTAKWVKLQKA